jgi:hypothetical protein
MFISTHGYGLKSPQYPPSADNGFFFPGSGAPVGWDPGCLHSLAASAEDIIARPTENAVSTGSDALSASASSLGGRPNSSVSSAGRPSDNALFSFPTALYPAQSPSNSVPATPAVFGRSLSTAFPTSRPPLGPESTDLHAAALQPHGDVSKAEFEGSVKITGAPSLVSLIKTAVPEPIVEAHLPHPHIINVGMRHGQSAQQWRHIMTADVLPRLAAFKPDIILISAGFDAHHKVRSKCL